jgi:Na+-translocating ferredoxin:NAD+ oxidoreductase RnfC subunit
MTDTKINVDATFGAEVKVGDIVEPGQQLGIDPNAGQPVISEIKGMVKEIIFDSEDHQLQIVISR